MRKMTCPNCGAPVRASDHYYDPPSRTASGRTIEASDVALRELADASEEFMSADSAMASFRGTEARRERAIEAARTIL